MDLSIQSGTGDDVPPNPFVYRVLDAARPGKSIRVLQHPQLGEVLVNLENPSYKIQVASRPWKQMSESSSDDLIGVKLSFHEGNRVPFMREKIYRVDEGNRVPLKVPLLDGLVHPERDGGRRSPEPLCLPRLGCSGPGKSIRVLQHPQLGEVLVNLEKPITQNTGCFAPLKTNVRVIVR